MSKYKGPTPGYAQRAMLQVSVRQQPEGGGLRMPPALKWNGLATSQQDLVVLIHGFNNHQGEAEVAYLGFRNLQAKELLASSAQFEKMLADVFWPGDADWGWFDLADFLVYPKTIGVAKASAPILAEYLMSRTDVLNLYFVGHSMGCRVVLETIEILRSRGHSTPIRKVCLMAAAVPTHEVSPGGRLAQALQTPDRVRVLFSPSDVVLQGAFPLGETAGGDGFLPEAVGRYGNIAVQPGKIDRDWIPNAGHSDYWGWNGSPESDVVAKEVANFLCFGPQIQSLRSQALAPARPRPPQRVLDFRIIGDP